MSDPITLDMSKAQPIGDQAVTLDMSKATPIDVAAQQRAELEASGAIPKSGSGTPKYIPGMAAPGSEQIPKPIEYAIRATPMLSGVDSVPSLITAARVAGGSLLGGIAGKGVVQASGGGETAQNVGEITGGLLGGGVAGTGLPRALLQTPLRELAAKNTGSILSLLEPRKALISYIKSIAADDSITAETHPATTQMLKSAIDALRTDTTEIPTAARTPLESYMAAAKQTLPDTASTGQLRSKAFLLRNEDSNIASTLTDVIERMKAEAPPPTSELYGKTAGKSNLKANQRQLASPTGSTAPVPAQASAGAHPPEIMRILNKPGDVSDADMQTLRDYFNSSDAIATQKTGMGGMKNYFSK